MKARIKQPESIAALFFIGEEKAGKIAEAFKSTSIKVTVPPRENYGGKIGSLLGLKGYASENVPPPEDIDGAELIMFADTDRKTLDGALAILREKGLNVRFKAVLTAYNKDFTLPELMGHMLAEEASILRRE